MKRKLLCDHEVEYGKREDWHRFENVRSSMDAGDGTVGCPGGSLHHDREMPGREDFLIDPGPVDKIGFFLWEHET